MSMPTVSPAVPYTGTVTPPWPSPPPSAPRRPASRRTSTATVVAVCVLAMLVSLATVFVGLVGVRAWAVAQAPAPAPTPANPPAVRTTPLTPTPAPGRPLPEQTVGPVEVTDEVQRGVVLVTGRTPSDTVAGTGMVLTASGEVLTNYHVVRSTESLTVTVASTGRSYSATLVGRDAQADVALLQLHDASGLETVTIDADPVDLGDVVVAAGNANGQGFVTAHRGNVLALDRSIQVRGPVEQDPPETLTGLIQTNAPAWPGDSGGPMYDDEGEVLGMTTAGGTEEREDRDVYAVPIARAMTLVDRIRAGDDAGSIVIGPKAYLGVTVQLDDSAGVVLERVVSGSAAADAGLRAGDRIVSLDGQRATTRLDLSHILDGVRPGETLDITWQTSSGRQQSGQVTLGESPLN